VNLTLSNIPDFASETNKTIFLSRVSNAVNDILAEKYKVPSPLVKVDIVPDQAKEHVRQNTKDEKKDDDDDGGTSFSIEAQEPQYTFDQIILEDGVLEELQYSIKFESVRNKVYDEWGLSKIEPSPKLALNFHGDSGTGKTMAAHGIANAMGRKIILASYAEIESKYHGDGPKNVKRLFQIASEANAVLFIDEADSLLSKRLTNVTQGSEQAINSMRSQLLIQIEQFTGVVIFATNLARNYDKAFVTRIRSIHFRKPNLAMRKKLWQIMLLPQLPLEANIDLDKLASIDDVCGRDIKNAVVKTAIKTAIDGNTFITCQALADTLNSIMEANYEISGKPLSEEEKKEVGEKVKKHLQEKKAVQVDASATIEGG